MSRPPAPLSPAGVITENQPRGVPSLAGMPTAPGLCHRRVPIFCVSGTRGPRLCVNGRPEWPPMTASTSRRSIMSALAAIGVEAKMYSEMFSAPPWMTAKRRPPRVNRTCRGSPRIQARASSSGIIVAKANQSSDHAWQSLSCAKPQLQSSAAKSRDSSQLPMTTGMPAARTRPMLASGSAQ